MIKVKLEANELLKPEMKAEWIAALRSGEYPQGKLKLRIDNKFCCLGVACEIALKHGVIETPEIRIEGGENVYLYDGAGEMLPDSVHNFLFMKKSHNSDSPYLKIYRWDEYLNSYDVVEELPLSTLNDERKGLTFDQIADLIEAFF